MSFNRDRAVEIAHHGDDRDTTEFFAGREREIESFRSACIRARQKTPSAFRLYNGAPGCGKSTLLDRIRSLCSKDPTLLAVRVRDEDLDSMAALKKRILDVAQDRASALKQIGTKVAGAIAEGLRAKTAAKDLDHWHREKRLSGLLPVLLFDEAQLLSRRQLQVVRSLHKDGITEHSVVLLAGLGHAKRVLTEAGISRSGYNADVDMGPMHEGEGVESTLQMLDAIGGLGTGLEREEFAARVERMSQLWPQHLCRAQEAACRLLVDAEGVISDVDTRALERLGEDARGAYYRGRLQHAAFGEDEELVQRIITTVNTGGVHMISDLELVCDEVIDQLSPERGKRYDRDPKEVCGALIAKGIVSHADGKYAVPIPSMVTWAQNQIEERNRSKNRSGTTMSR